MDDARNRYLFEGVVAGISGYGNCIGIPNVGGEIFFSSSFPNNIREFMNSPRSFFFFYLGLVKQLSIF